MTGLEIIEKYLIIAGYDGLFCPGECSCEIKNLHPCGADISYCQPGYFQPNKSKNCPFFIGLERKTKGEK